MVAIDSNHVTGYVWICMVMYGRYAMYMQFFCHPCRNQAVSSTSRTTSRVQVVSGRNMPPSTSPGMQAAAWKLKAIGFGRRDGV